MNTRYFQETPPYISYSQCSLVKIYLAITPSNHWSFRLIRLKYHIELHIEYISETTPFSETLKSCQLEIYTVLHDETCENAGF